MLANQHYKHLVNFDQKFYEALKDYFKEAGQRLMPSGIHKLRVGIMSKSSVMQRRLRVSHYRNVKPIDSKTFQ